MQPKEKLKIVAVTCLIWTLCLSSCANISIKTWFLDGKVENELIRKDSAGAIQERLSYVNADGYLCYSPADDKAWRDRMAICCAQSGI